MSTVERLCFIEVLTIPPLPLTPYRSPTSVNELLEELEEEEEDLRPSSKRTAELADRGELLVEGVCRGVDELMVGVAEVVAK